MPTADIGATATAEASPANAMTCVKPFTIPDKWKEVGSDAPWNGDFGYDAFDNKGDPLPVSEADVYIPALLSDTTTPNPDYTGYNNVKNKGHACWCCAPATGNNINTSFYFSLSMTDDMGGDDYRWNIANCNKSIYKWGDSAGPGARRDGRARRSRASRSLIARDPGAHWDDGNEHRGGQRVCERTARASSRSRSTTRTTTTTGSGTAAMRRLELPTGSASSSRASQGNEIYGRIIPIAGIRDKNGPQGTAAFPLAIRLVQ